MVKAKDGTDSVESFEMEAAEEESEEEEEDEDEVFVKKKGRHGSENGSARKPLIKGSKKNGARNGAMHTEIREGGSRSSPGAAQEQPSRPMRLLKLCPQGSRMPRGVVDPSAAFSLASNR